MNNLQTFDKTVFEHVKKTNEQFTKHFHNTYTIGITHEGLFKSLQEGKTFYLFEKKVLFSSNIQLMINLIIKRALYDRFK